MKSFEKKDSLLKIRESALKKNLVKTNGPYKIIAHANVVGIKYKPYFK